MTSASRSSFSSQPSYTAREHEARSPDHAGDRTEVAPSDRLLKDDCGEHGEHGERNQFLHDLELAAGKAGRIADAVCRNSETIFEKRDAPADKDRCRYRRMRKAQLAVPGKGHEDVRND